MRLDIQIRRLICVAQNDLADESMPRRQRKIEQAIAFLWAAVAAMEGLDTPAGEEEHEAA